MCPPVKSPPREIDSNWNNEQLILFLYNSAGNANLPGNVLVDANPYQHSPSNLPEGMWYLICSGGKKDSVYGVWRVWEEPHEIYSDSTITGWRTTLEYFEFQTLQEQRTDWIMREYSITKNEPCEKEQKKGSRVLCRIFLRSGHSSESETNTQKCKGVIESGETHLPAPISSNTNSPPTQDSENWVQELEALIDTDDNIANFAPQDFNELGCIARGDYLELNDLRDPISNRPPPLLRDNLLQFNAPVDLGNNRSPLLDDFVELNDLDPGSESSSSLSSCTSTVSDEYFDSVTLLREMEEEKNKNIQCFSAPDRPDDVISQPAALTGSQLNNAGRIEVVAAPQIGPTDAEHMIDKTEPEQSAKRQNSDTGNEGAGSTSGGDQGAGPSHTKKASPSRLKKLKLFLCFSF